MYILLKKHSPPGYKTGYVPVAENEDIVVLSEQLKRLVKGGCPVDDLMIVKKVNFELKMGVRFEGESEG